jgi:hypothetical protein
VNGPACVCRRAAVASAGSNQQVRLAQLATARAAQYVLRSSVSYVRHFILNAGSKRPGLRQRCARKRTPGHEEARKLNVRTTSQLEPQFVELKQNIAGQRGQDATVASVVLSFTAHVQRRGAALLSHAVRIFLSQSFKYLTTCSLFWAGMCGCWWLWHCCHAPPAAAPKALPTGCQLLCLTT